MRGIGGVILFAVFLLVFFFRQAIDLYADWLWFLEVGYVDIFTRILFGKTILGILAAGLLSLLLYLNFKAAAKPQRGFRFNPRESVIELPPVELFDPMLQRLLLPGALLIAFMALPQAAGRWELLFLFLNATPFEIADPQFGLDLGFYFFRLPALLAVYHWLIFALDIGL